MRHGRPCAQADSTIASSHRQDLLYEMSLEGWWILDPWGVTLWKFLAHTLKHIEFGALENIYRRSLVYTTLIT